MDGVEASVFSGWIVEPSHYPHPRSEQPGHWLSALGSRVLNPPAFTHARCGRSEMFTGGLCGPDSFYTAQLCSDPYQLQPL